MEQKSANNEQSCSKLHFSTTDRLPKHDLVFGSPINDPVAGIPLGDGDTGSLVWFEADAIHIHINKTDLWDDTTQESDLFCSGVTEDLTTLRHGGELVIRFDSPCLDMIYQKEFEARLSLADAPLRLNAETPFSHIQAECFTSNEKKTTALRLRCTAPEAAAPDITLSRWGSRSYWRWYAMNRVRPEAGLDGTETAVQDDRIYICQKLNGTQFCLGLAIDAPRTEIRRLNCHSGSLRPAAAAGSCFTLYWNISPGESAQDAQHKTRQALDAALAEGFDSMHKAHAAQWADFWNTSYVSIPQDSIENYYYLSLYYSNSECRGAYPPLFTNGIWGFRHDFSPWAYYFHYNMQHMYGPLEPSGHGALAENYYKMRREGLPAARLYAEKVKEMPGAFYHDVTDRYGRGADYDSHNCTPGAQIAMAMYRHWRMNGDETFLHDTALPVMRGAAEFYLGMLQKETDGLYHIHGTTAYEGTPLFHDTLTDLDMVRALFGALMRYASPEEKTLYTDILTHLPEPVLVQPDADEVKDGRLLLGIGAGRPVHGEGLVLAVGRDDDGNPVRKNYGDPAKECYGFPDTEMSPLYPAGIFGLKDKGTPLFDAMTNQILLHHTADECMYWCMMPLYLARMGMAEELYRHMESMAGTWLIYPCGLGAERIAGKLDKLERLFYNDVTDCDAYRDVSDYYSGSSEKNEAYGFRHFDMETLPIIAHGVCESLLQSYDGVLRICPAIRKEDAVQFCLYGEGGFRVRCSTSPEHFRLEIDSLRGEECRICLPEHIAAAALTVSVSGGSSAVPLAALPAERCGSETHIVLTGLLKAGETAVVADGRGDSALFAPAPPADPNPAWKSCGGTQLGTPPLSPRKKS